MNKEELKENIKEKIARAEKTKEDYFSLNSGSVLGNYHDGRTDGLIQAFNLIDQLDEPAKPVVPQFVADYFEEDKRNLDERIFNQCVNVYNTGTEEWDEFDEWFTRLDTSIETLIKMKDGYEVEKEPLYIVKFMECIEYTVFNRDMDGSVVEDGTSKWGTKLTEKEIKSIDERYWAFAEEVSE